MIAYFDTSAVVPLLVEEPGTDISLRVFCQAGTVATVRMTFAEAAAALARASRIGRLTDDAHDRALAGLESVWAQMDVLDVDDDLVRAAGALAREHALRGSDAVPCAAALRVTSGSTVALAGDRDLLAAWQREGLQVLDTQSGREGRTTLARLAGPRSMARVAKSPGRSCAMTHATSPAAVSKERAREAMTRFVAVWEKGDLAAVDEIFSKELTYHAPPFPDMGRDGFREFVDGFRAGFTEIHVQMQEHLVDGATSVHRWTVEAVLSGTTPLLPGVEATGKHTTGQGAHVLHWSGDQVSEAWHFGDWLGWLTKAGVLPPMPGTGA